MAAENSLLGRAIEVRQGGTVIAGVTAKTITNLSENPDITAGEDSGYMTYSDKESTKGLEISVEGFLRDPTLLDTAMGSGSKYLTDITLNWTETLDPTNTTPASITGDFVFSGFELSGESGAPCTYSFTLKSSGAYVFTNES